MDSRRARERISCIMLYFHVRGLDVWERLVRSFWMIGFVCGWVIRFQIVAVAIRIVCICGCGCGCECSSSVSLFVGSDPDPPDSAVVVVIGTEMGINSG